MTALVDDRLGIEAGDAEAELRMLLTRIARRDAAAMERFYRLTETRVHRFARSRLNDSFAAADILHETMLEVWKAAGRYEGRSRVTTWILGIAHHKVIDQLRRDTRRPTVEVDESLVDPDAQPLDAAVAAAQDRARLQRCLSGLSDKHREVLHLVFFQDLPYNEIAVVVGCPEGTVKTRVFHAKEALRKCLSKTTG